MNSERVTRMSRCFWVVVSLWAVAPTAFAQSSLLPRLSRKESEKRKTTNKPEAPPVEAQGDASPPTAKAPVATQPSPPSEAPPAAAAEPATSPRHHHHRWRVMTDDVVEENEQGEQTRSLKDTLQGAQSDDEKLDRLARFAEENSLDDEATRSQFVASARALSNEDARADALVTLLMQAPITERTGREVLQATATLNTDAARERVLRMFVRIRESDLVRGPLAASYLDEAEKLKGEHALATVLTQLMHPEPVAAPAVQRALNLARRLQSPRERLRVLREVTDHQELSESTVAAYKAVAESLDSAAKEEALERLNSAIDEGDDTAIAQHAPHRRAGMRHRWDFFDPADLAKVQHDAMELAARDQARMRREARQMREGAQRFAREMRRRFEEQFRRDDRGDADGDSE